MSKKNFQPFHLLPVALFAVVLFFMQDRSVQEVKREPTSVPKMKRIYPVRNKRIPLPSISRGPASVKPYDQSSFDRIVVSNNSVTLARGNILADNVAAIPLEDWKPGMKPLLYDDGVYGFYEKRPGEKSIPVAYNPDMKTFRPISSIIHLKGIDEETRENLKKEGYQEYLYFKNIQKLSLKTTPEEAVKVYQELEKRGHKVKLEVIDLKPIPF